MANIYVGFHDQRNSSRVLKPPGGDTSNIFSNEDQTSLIPNVVSKQSFPQRSETTHYKGSSIQDVLRTEMITTTAITTESNSLNDLNESTEGNVELLKIEEKALEATGADATGNTTMMLSDTKTFSEKHSSSAIVDILSQEEIQEKKIKGQNSQRVPPGGYSSGLW